MLGRVVMIMVGMLASTAAVGDDQSPEVAYVSVSRALLRSGPGSDFFPTDRVPWGTRLEIYHEVDSGWCAVRPLSQSFSWILADAVETTEDAPGIGRVVGKGVTARIGSNLSDNRDVECITLTPGETVQILGSETRNGNGGTIRWLKISPPAGEFRWIRRDLLQETPPHFDHRSHQTKSPEVTDLPKIAAEPIPRLVSTVQSASLHDRPIGVETTQVDLADLQEPQTLAAQLTGGTEANPGERSPAWRAVRPDARPIGGSVTEPEGFQDAPIDMLSDAEIPSPPHLPSDLASATHQPVDEGYAQQTMELIRAELDLMLRGSTRLWSFDELIAKTQEIASGTDNPDIQSESLELLATLDRLEKIRLRHQQLLTTAVVGTSSPASNGSPLRPGPANTAVGLEKAFRFARDRFAPYRPPSVSGTSLASTGPRTTGKVGTSDSYDGSGWLTTVHSTRQGAPQYALTDNEGRIVQLVEPQPGLNLRPYLRQEVGLIGRKSYATELQKPVLTAERVVVLNRR